MGGPRRPIAVRRIDTYRQPSKRSSTRREGLGSSPGYFEFMTDIRSCRQCHMYMSAMTYGSGDSRAGNAPFWVFGGPPVVLCHRIKSVNTMGAAIHVLGMPPSGYSVDHPSSSVTG
ncbi:hypothetical protein QE152_g37051 [Popillia japonica]|uniref:Uncharacterized protein n=1 Tax=Popillia japonica TaxID=7064 RepID=A0AAW1IBE5_POPJA